MREQHDHIYSDKFMDHLNITIISPPPKRTMNWLILSQYLYDQGYVLSAVQTFFIINVLFQCVQCQWVLESRCYTNVALSLSLLELINGAADHQMSRLVRSYLINRCNSNISPFSSLLLMVDHLIQQAYQLISPLYINFNNLTIQLDINMKVLDIWVVKLLKLKALSSFYSTTIERTILSWNNS